MSGAGPPARPRRPGFPGRAARALRWAVLALVLAGCGPPPPQNVVLIVIDTLRKDHLSVYGYERRTSPFLERLGAQGWVFENHVAAASHTVPSTLTLLLSQQPPEHGFGYPHKEYYVQHRPRYPEELLFLAEVFSAAGYRTGGFVANPWLQESNGFAQGFDVFHYSTQHGSHLTDPAIGWLQEEAAQGDRPFFLYMHYFDVHGPYNPPAPWRNRFVDASAVPPEAAMGRVDPRVAPGDPPPAWLEWYEGLYDGAIAYVDHEIQRLVAALDALGVRGRTVIAVTSDHGDEFLDHGGLGHGSTVYGELVRVPLLLVDPARLEGGRRVTYLTHHVDLAPTLLELAGVPRPETFRGRGLLAPAGPAFAETGPWRAVYADGRKLVVNARTGQEQLFDAGDERDQRPLPAGPAAAPLRDALRGYEALVPGLPDVPRSAGAWSEQEKERLRALGYAQ